MSRSAEDEWKRQHDHLDARREQALRAKTDSEPLPCLDPEALAQIRVLVWEEMDIDPATESYDPSLAQQLEELWRFLHHLPGPVSEYISILGEARKRLAEAGLDD